MAVELATAYIALVPSALGIAAGVKSALAGAEVQNVAAEAGKSASSSFAGGFKTLGGAIAAVGIAEVLKKAIGGAANFQAETQLLVTAGGEAQSALMLVRNGIESIAVATGTSTEQLASGMYTLEKAGFRGANGLNVLRVAAEGARAENVDLGTMTNALTSIMRSYNLPASAAAQITNELVAASGAAKTTMSEFAGSLSTVLPIASAAGLSFAQVGGAIATLTSHGTSAQEATQELANTIRSLQAPNAVASKEMAQFGLNSNTVSKSLGKLGLTGTLTELTSAITSRMGPAGLVLRNAFNQSSGASQDMQIEISKMPPSLQTMAKAFSSGQLTMSQWRSEARKLPADQRLMMQGFMSTYTQAHKFNDLLTSGSPAAETYTAALSKMVGGATGLNTTLMLTGGSAATFARDVQAVSAAGDKGGQTVSTWAATQKNFNVQMGRLGEVAQTAGINLGSTLLPKLTGLGSWIANHVGDVKMAGTVVLGLGVAMLTAAAAAKVIAAIEGVYNVVTGEATAKTGLQVIALGVQKLAMFAGAVAAQALAAAQWLLNAAMDANPIVLIVLAIVALVAGLVLAYQHSQTFRNAVEDVWKAVQAAASAIGGAFVTAWHTVVNAFNSVTAFLRQWGPLILSVLLPFIGLPLLIVQHWSQISDFFTKIGTSIASAVSNAFDTVINFFKALPGRILALLATLPHLLNVGAQDAIAGFIVGIAYGAIGIWKFFTDLVPTAVLKIGAFGLALAKTGGDALAAMASGLVTAASAVWKFFTDLPGTAERLIAHLGADLKNIGSAALAAMAAGIITAASAVVSFFTKLPGNVVKLLSAFGTDLKNIGSAALGAMASGVSAGFAAVVSFVSSIPGRVVRAIGDVAGTLSGTGGSLIGGLFNGVTSGFGAVSRWVSNLPNTIGGMFSGCVNWLVGAGEQIMKGLLNGIVSGLDAVKGFVSGIASKIVSWKGPPAYDATILVGNGRLIMQGLMRGIGSQMPALRSTLGNVTAAVANGVGAGQMGATASATAPLAGATSRQGPAVGQINVTAYNPAEAAALTAAEIGWLQLTRGR